MKRHLNIQSRRITSNQTDRFCLSLITTLSKRAITHLTIVQPEKKILIYDNAPQFTSIDYSGFEIKGINISPSAPKAGRKQVFCSPMRPGMNAYTERVIGSIRREALDHFLIFSENQVHKIIGEYVNYYNQFRPHQSIERIPEGNITPVSGSIRKDQILGGLHHHYYRSSA